MGHVKSTSLLVMLTNLQATASLLFGAPRVGPLAKAKAKPKSNLFESRFRSRFWCRYSSNLRNTRSRSRFSSTSTSAVYRVTAINLSRKWIEWAEWAALLCTADSPFPGHVYCRHPVHTLRLVSFVFPNLATRWHSVRDWTYRYVGAIDGSLPRLWVGRLRLQKMDLQCMSDQSLTPAWATWSGKHDWLLMAI